MTATLETPAQETAARERVPARGRPTLPRRWRRPILMVHVMASLGWFGMTIVLVVLTVAALDLTDVTQLRSAYQFQRLLITTVIIPSAVATLLTGLVLSLFTHWGLVKHWWPLLKLIATVGTIAFTVSHSPDLVAYAIGNAGSSDAAYKTVQDNLVVLAVLHPVALGVVTWMSFYKPWGRIRRRRDQP
ncbi:hypothetical protein [Nonomuraea sp. LPB2021202275-12-8]|uniref:hypothetical protein n=1 Tax=Nonomuraea sp. LPB2021202275-12-8 TaxID=3120159 RepID=UPI00300D71A0